MQGPNFSIKGRLNSSHQSNIRLPINNLSNSLNSNSKASLPTINSSFPAFKRNQMNLGRQKMGMLNVGSLRNQDLIPSNQKLTVISNTNIGGNKKTWNPNHTRNINNNLIPNINQNQNNKK